MFNKKTKQEEKPNKVKITISLNQCKKSIQGSLDSYENLIDGYREKIVNLKKQKRFTEAERHMQKLKLVLVRQMRMENLMDRVDQIQFMVDEAFAKNEVYKTLGTALNEANKINITPEIKDLLKDLKNFDEHFTQGIDKIDTMFGKVTDTITEVDKSTSMSLDSEIEAMINQRLESVDEETTSEAENESNLFKL